MRYGAFSALLAAAMLAACATEIKRQPVEMTAAAPADTGKRFLLQSDVTVTLDSGYSRTLRAQTEFATAGRVAQGLVLRPTQTVLTVEGAHVHEAYAVLRDDQLVGFYLPVEKAFSALPQAALFPLVERKQ